MDKEQVTALWGAIETLKTAITSQGADLAANTAATHEVKSDVKAIKESTEGLVAMFEAGKGAFKVLGWLGTVAKWVGAIGAGFAGIYGAYTAYRYGVSPAEISPK